MNNDSSTVDNEQNELVVKDIKAEDVEVEIIMSKDEAETLTMDIQSTSSALYVLLKQAHDEKAWVAMGYNSWTSYIENEFEFSRARSYQLINQATVIEEINEASGVPLYITEREARSIKSRLPNITEKLNKDVKDADLPEEEAKDKALEIIREEPKDSIDKASDFSDDDSSYEEQEYNGVDENNPENNNFKGNGKLSDEDKFFFDNLEATLKIFQAMPDAVSFGKLIKNSNVEKTPLIKNAEKAFSWITLFLDEID